MEDVDGTDKLPEKLHTALRWGQRGISCVSVNMPTEKTGSVFPFRLWIEIVCAAECTVYFYTAIRCYSVTNPFENTLINYQGWRPQVLYLLETISVIAWAAAVPVMREMHLTDIDVSFKVIWVGNVIYHVLVMLGFSIHVFMPNCAWLFCFVHGRFLTWICYNVDQTCIVGSQKPNEPGSCKIQNWRISLHFYPSQFSLFSS